MDTLKKLVLGGAATLLVFAATGCNTVKGVGKDIQKGGEAVEETAEEVQEEIRE